MTGRQPIETLYNGMSEASQKRVQETKERMMDDRMMKDAAEEYLAAVKDGTAGTPEKVAYFEGLFMEALGVEA